jgi:hypothetical protein
VSAKTIESDLFALGIGCNYRLFAPSFGLRIEYHNFSVFALE